MTEPTDAELRALLPTVQLDRKQDPKVQVWLTQKDAFAFALRVLSKFGTPPAVAPWRSAVLDLIDECPGLTMEQDQWLSRRVKELDFASTPQPTQAQAVAVPLTPFIPVQRERLFYNRPENVGKGLVMADWHRVVQYVEAAHGIKGGQHG